MGDNTGIRTEKMIELADTATANSKGVSFYCSKRHTYMFIESTKHQIFNGKTNFTPTIPNKAGSTK
jgi:hypothetical protein